MLSAGFDYALFIFAFLLDISNLTRKRITISRMPVTRISTDGRMFISKSFPIKVPITEPPVIDSHTEPIIDSRPADENAKPRIINRNKYRELGGNEETEEYVLNEGKSKTSEEELSKVSFKNNECCKLAELARLSHNKLYDCSCG